MTARVKIYDNKGCLFDEYTDYGSYEDIEEGAVSACLGREDYSYDIDTYDIE